MANTKKLAKANQKFRKENPALYAALAYECLRLARRIKKSNNG